MKVPKKGWTYAGIFSLRRIFLAGKIAWLNKVKNQAANKQGQKEPCSQLCDSMSTTQFGRAPSARAHAHGKALTSKPPCRGTEGFKNKEKRREGKKKKLMEKTEHIGMQCCMWMFHVSVPAQGNYRVSAANEGTAGKTSGILLLPFIGILSQFAMENPCLDEAGVVTRVLKSWYINTNYPKVPLLAVQGSRCSAHGIQGEKQILTSLKATVFLK